MGRKKKPIEDYKFCPYCELTKPINDFVFSLTKASRGLYPYSWICRSCKFIHDQEYQKQYHSSESGKIVRKAGNNKWIKVNPEKNRLSKKKYKETHHEEVLAKGRIYDAKMRKERAPDIYAKNARRRAMKLQACPPWARSGPIAEQIKEIYRTCPNGSDVDHIVALKAKDSQTSEWVAVGLHVPWNLQHLKADKNLKKSSRLQINKIVYLVN